MKIYLDNAATTPMAKEVLEAMLPYFSEKFGNASSIHSYGREAAEAIEKSREKIASKLNAEPGEIIFTSGGTESNNIALKGIALANKAKGQHIITTKIEHSCVINSAKFLERNGFNVTYLEVDRQGIVEPEKFEKAIRKDTILVTVIHGNNEIGTVQNIGELGKICREHEIYFHTDACQSFTKEEIDVKKQNLDLVTINAHKIYGPKGVGALYLRNGVKIEPLLHGGGHEKNLRSGTYNVPGIAGFAKASEIITKPSVERMRNLRDYLIKRILDEIPKSKLNGHPTKRLCNNVNFSFKNIEGESMLMLLDNAGIAVSTGSACSSHSLKPSHVLTAIGLPPEDAHGSLRISLGMDNTQEEIDYAIENLKKIVGRLRNLSPFR
ncbi:MAG: cysteine desulfurase [Candidatus Altiarchaeum hamiconexum]|uniref:cysteine desulfurase n=1 Tax=Candidatus Altarchaeum hamiconexum TaxID=1803513 RepID=A0A8J7Z0K9_9ARCH|nr:cysteine desulfurase [Candidatus Altarchaeum hamiconexum]OIQ04580.1 MAG: cysteine desulfurase NifS [Candidatus Altarchaeum sp. CG2_30_32_3053]PIV26997.1 MAG: cysteine desulfurase NifS [Candidatus Altarchaeum sp. CG03_land_8_20_14_0_80_32_618]PJC13542.1 MAG: cysteine desulfurase NifS [Candidatus Altarchaeum sp. CG_4_9_14_0_8_um_filter_32_206]NCN69371.1 cysteine desulfurase [Candidatus Altarchaeum hamiconexum]